MLASIVMLALASPQSAPPDGMVPIAGGEFMMGSDDAESYPPERPAHRVRVDSFFIDTTEVTNEQFKAFTDATKYVTMAERIPDWEQLKLQVPAGIPKPPDETLVAGSVVFIAPSTAIETDDPSRWWHWVPGANWRHPEGPESTLDGRWSHAVTHVSWDDAAALRNGLASDFPPRPSSSSQLVENLPLPSMDGATISCPAPSEWRTSGKASFQTRI